MRDHLEAGTLLLGVAASVAIGAKRAGLPYNVALVASGLGLVLLDVLPRRALDPSVVLWIFLPLLVFEGALFADVAALRRAAGPILGLAAPGVAVSAGVTAAAAAVGLGMPLGAAFPLGVLLSITDTVSVLLAVRGLGFPKRLAAILEGESLLNDGTALVLLALATDVATGQTPSATAAARSLLLAVGGGAAIGGAAAGLARLVLARTPDHVTAVLVTLVLALATALGAERVHASPVIAVVILGLAVGASARGTASAARLVALRSFWEVVGFAVNVVLFFLVGMQLDAATLLREAPAIGVAVLSLHAGRAAAVYGTFAVGRALGRPATPLAWQHALVAGNVKGALPMAAALALPAALPERERIVAVVFGVTFVTLVTQALPFRRIVRALGLGATTSRRAIDDARARLVAARRGQAVLDELLAAGIVDRAAHAVRRAELQRSILAAEAELREEPPRGRDVVVEGALLEAKRAAVLEAARGGLVSDEAASSLVAELDDRALTLAREEER